ncbi:MAG: DNA repair protein RecN [Acidiferrobacterales bacterium]
MLSYLYIRDFTIVEKLELVLEPGFTVLTGETGAGKSIVIDALSFALGERADSTVIRHGARRAEIVASFDLAIQQDAAIWLEAHDLFADQECVVRRVIDIDRPSKGFINGRPVPMQMLRDLGQHLIDIHGQHEHQSVLRRDGQRQILDDYAGLDEAVKRLTRHYQDFKSLQSRLETLRQQSADRTARLDLLGYQVQELEALGVTADEVTALEEEHARLANGAELLAGVQGITQALYDDDEGSVSQTLASAVNRLEQLCQYDARLGELIGLLNEASIQVDEAASQLHHYVERLELDPQRLRWIDQRLASFQDVARKHQVRPEELSQVLERLRTELHDLKDFDLNLAKLEEDIETERQAYMELAGKISRKRKAAAKKLSQSVTDDMQQLGMPGGCFEVRLDPLPRGEMSASGQERPEFLVSTNPGQPSRALNKVASGGELSRISLALQVVAARVARIPTLIFDEVDVGIGGRVAEIVGQQLRALGGSREVVCITHLAQVAALGDRHLLVSKTSQDASTRTQVRQLSGRERITEIARMIGGIKISQQTLDHAQDMLARASEPHHVPA